MGVRIHPHVLTSSSLLGEGNVKRPADDHDNLITDSSIMP